jgi:hypothetical protein
MQDGYYIEHMGHDFSVFQTFRPENLHFVKKISEVESIEYEISNTARDNSGNLIVYRDIPTDQDMVKPDKHYFRLFYTESDVRTDLMAGKIDATNMARGREFVRIQGKDWLGYLEQRKIPFNPNSGVPTWADDNLFGPTITSTIPPDGTSYHVTGRDVGSIVEDVVTFAFSKPHSDPMITAVEPLLGYTYDHFELALGDSTTILQIVDGLSEYWPGFDYRVSVDRALVLWTPHRFGNPDTTADDGPTGANIAWTFGDTYGHPPLDLEFTNNGVQASHLLGRGAGSKGSKQYAIGKALGASDIQTAVGRIDDDVDFGEQAKTQGTVSMRTRKEFIFRAQEVHEITLTVDPRQIPNFWSVIRPGFAVWVREDMIMHEVNSAQKVISMDCTVNNQGDATVQLGLNQIYNTSTHYGTDEA